MTSPNRPLQVRVYGNTTSGKTAFPTLGGHPMSHGRTLCPEGHITDDDDMEPGCLECRASEQEQREDAMSQPTHTPGPWKAVNDPFGHPGVVSSCGVPLAAIISHGTDAHSRKVEEATAHLIAAAPQMLEALKRMEQAVGQASQHPEWSHGVAQALIPGRDAMFEAITAAEGDQG